MADLPDLTALLAARRAIETASRDSRYVPDALWSRYDLAVLEKNAAYARYWLARDEVLLAAALGEDA